MDKRLLNFALQEADRQGVPRQHIQAILQIESSGGIDIGPSRAGARGPMQLMPATAKEQGIDINDPMDNIRGGVMYYKKMLNKFKVPEIAIAAYNAGPGNVIKYGGIPPFKETKDYVRKFRDMIGGQAKVDKPQKFPMTSEPGKPLVINLEPPKPYDPNFDVEAATESNFASLLSKIGIGGKKKRSPKKKLPGILDGIL